MPPAFATAACPRPIPGREEVAASLKLSAMPPRSRFRVVLRWFVHVACGLSAVVLVATLAIWVRSYWAGDSIEYLRVERWPGPTILVDGHPEQQPGESGYDGVQLRFGHGQVGVGWSRSFNIMPSGVDPGWQHVAIAPEPVIPPSLPPAWLSRHGFAAQQFKSGFGPRQSTVTWAVAAPCWFIALLSAIAPAVWLRGYAKRRRRRVRAARNQCVACGYDLKASPERCPECGAPVPAALNANLRPSPCPPPEREG